jgi:hypothetical protein
MTKRPHIMLATPCFGGLVSSLYMQSVLGLMQTASATGFDLSHALLGHDALITRARNTLLGCFMESEASHILFVDSDIGFESGQVARMLVSGLEIVAGMYPLKAFNFERAAYNHQTYGEVGESSLLMYVGKPATSEPRESRGGFIAADYAGTGFLLVRRSAVERMIAAYPETRYRAIHAWPFPDGPERERYALFDTMIDHETGEYLSEDYAFCRRWRDIGGEIWLDTACKLTHVGSTEFHGQPAARFRAAPLGATG